MKKRRERTRAQRLFLCAFPHLLLHFSFTPHPPEGTGVWALFGPPRTWGPPWVWPVEPFLTQAFACSKWSPLGAWALQSSSHSNVRSRDALTPCQP